MHVTYMGMCIEEPRTIVGSTPCSKAPAMLKMSPASHMMINAIDKPSAELLLKFSMICGEKTTTQQAIETEPAMPLMASRSRDTILKTR